MYMFNKNCPSYVEKETGIGWYLKTIASSVVGNTPIYVMESTKDAHVGA